MNLRIASVLSLAAVMAIASAAPMTFKVGAGSAAQQLATVESNTEFEDFIGRTDKVTGSISFDPATRKGSGTITVDAKSISTGIDLRDDHMRSANWMDTEKHPTIKFATTKVTHKSGNTYEVEGNLTMKGVTKKVKTNATVTHRKASAATAAAGFKGDVVQVKTTLNVRLSDYSVTIPAPARGKVAPTVKLNLSVFGQTGA
jgi:polyisoprenoid-binding protein YceI